MAAALPSATAGLNALCSSVEWALSHTTKRVRVSGAVLAAEQLLRTRREMADIVVREREQRAAAADELAALRLAVQLADCQRLLLLANELAKAGDVHATYAAMQLCQQRGQAVDAAAPVSASGSVTQHLEQLNHTARHLTLTIRAQLANQQADAVHTAVSNRAQRTSKNEQTTADTTSAAIRQLHIHEALQRSGQQQENEEQESSPVAVGAAGSDEREEVEDEEEAADENDDGTTAPARSLLGAMGGAVGGAVGGLGKWVGWGKYS